MAIIGDLKSLRHCPTTAFTPAADEVFSKAVATLSRKPGFDKRSYPLKLKLFDCYCDLSNVPVTEILMKTPQMQDVFDGFCVAVMSGNLVQKNKNERLNICREIFYILTKPI